MPVFLFIRRKWSWNTALLWLVAGSLFFYAQWSLVFAALLLGSISGNYLFGRGLLTYRQHKKRSRNLLLCAIASNVAFLGYFKYANFFIENLHLLVGSSIAHVDLLLPVGISFYTFIQMGYLIDVYNGQVADHRFSRYCLFASFFPYITSGPLVFQKELIAQCAVPKQAGVSLDHFAVGLSIFAIGLFKKVVLADGIGPYADTVFSGVADGALPALGVAGIGALAYTLQLYFDFSGYSDMAVGIGFLFGFRLPLNFNSPLKAGSIIDFWHRWHMTMTRFFTNYVYSPIAVTLMRRCVRKSYGRVRRFLVAAVFPIIVTFTLAGLWHGAGWTFVIFGLIHGVALAVNHSWREAHLPAPPYAVGWLLTMGVVIVGLVVFRAENVPVALTMLGAMIGLNTASPTPNGPATLAVDSTAALAWILTLGLVALLCPNTQEIVGYHQSTADLMSVDRPRWLFRWTWRPSLGWAMISALVLMIALGAISRQTVFLYYRF